MVSFCLMTVYNLLHRKCTTTFLYNKYNVNKIVKIKKETCPLLGYDNGTVQGVEILGLIHIFIF